MRPRIPLAVAMLLGVLAGACSPPPIDWQDAVPLPPGLPATGMVGFDSLNQLIAAPPPTVTPPFVAAQCPNSVRLARDTSGNWYSVWWSLRDDSTAAIVVAYSGNGVTWERPVTVDSMDAGRFACRRPPPSIDAWGGHVHVAYSMAAKEGPGIFASHSMNRGTMFHSPVAVVYGERIGRTAVAARGNVVVVAYEDPNGSSDHIGLAVSRTMAHLFQSRHIVSPTAGSARNPRLALRDGRIAVMWSRGSDSTASPMVRLGKLQ